MNEEPKTVPSDSDLLYREVCEMAGRVATILGDVFPGVEGPMANSLNFLRAAYEEGVARRPEADQQAREQSTRLDRPTRLDRLVSRFGFSPEERTLLVLAGMADEHEGFSAIFRSLHPRHEARVSVGFAAQLLCRDGRERVTFREMVEAGRLVASGAVRVVGDVPLFERSFVLAEGLWSVLHGLDVWPANIIRDGPTRLFPVEEWYRAPGFCRAVEALKKWEPVTICVTDDHVPVAFHYASLVVQQAGYEGSYIHSLATNDPEWECLASLHLVARGIIPVFQVTPSDVPSAGEFLCMKSHPDPIVICSRTGSAALRGARAVLSVAAEPLVGRGRISLWQQVLPQLSEQAEELASRFPIDVLTAREVQADLSFLERVQHRTSSVTDVATSIRGRAGLTLNAGMMLIRPQSGWGDLVLPSDRLRQLEEAVERLRHQTRVLDEWGFLEGRPGAHGVRLLFAGPPGTGKTLAAEVMAHALEVNLLVVDVSRVVSKWIGETEKNLAGVFDAAERTQAVLFFDEADALFGKRTEVSDAHDRYANLETAYLLARLEKFEGVAILATNLRDNIDAAFTRRLEFIVDFDEPGREERYQLWTGHVPKRAPLAEDVNLYTLAALYPVVGGTIRNAAVAAGFLAAADRTPIAMTHFIHAIRREYEKAGRAFPAVPHGVVAS